MKTGYLSIRCDEFCRLVKQIIMATKLKDSYVKGNEAKYRLKYRTIPDLLRYHSSERPDKAAYVFLSADGTSESITWKEVYDKSMEIAKSLVEFGVKRNEVVAISFRACPDWLFVNFGILLTGAIPVGVAFTYKDGIDVIALMERLEKCSTIFLDPGQNNEIWDIFIKIIDAFDKYGNLKSQQMHSLKQMVCRVMPTFSLLINLNIWLKTAHSYHKSLKMTLCIFPRLQEVQGYPKSLRIRIGH